MAENNGRTNGTASGSYSDRGWSDKIKGYLGYISVEPLMVCWLVPSCFLLVAVQNLELDKSCRVNFQFSDEVCDNMIDKGLNNIVCDSVITNLVSWNNLTEFSTNADDFIYLNSSTETISPLERDVCIAEIKSQQLDTRLNVYTAPIDSIFGLLMILFAAGWSDRKGLRKPCMLLPMLGELGAFIVYLIAVIFFKQLPMEFNSVLGKLVPAATGKENLMLMGVFSYMTETTPEADRTFRFGIFAVFLQILPVLFVPFSGTLFTKLGYTWLLLLCIGINVIGLLYLIFVLKEVKRKGTSEKDGLDNPAFVPVNGIPAENLAVNGRHALEMDAPKVQKNCLLDFFNPIIVVDAIKVIVRERAHHARRIVILILVLYFITLAPAYGEDPNEYNFTRLKLNWGGEEYSPFVSYSSFSAMVGVIIMVGGVGKLCKLADPLMGFVSSICSAISRLFFAFATSNLMMYIARSADMFVSVRVLTLKSIVSTVIESDEIGKMFMIMGILESFGRLVFVPVYAGIYEKTLQSWSGAFYIFSFFILVISAVLYLIIYIVVRRFKRAIKNEKGDGVIAESYQITHM